MHRSRIYVHRPLGAALALLIVCGCTSMSSPSPSSPASSAGTSGHGPTDRPASPASDAGASDLASPAKKEIAMKLVASAENSSLDWKAQYGYIEDITDGRGDTGGIAGFTSGTGDMLELVQNYTREHPSNGLAKYLPALTKVNGSASLAGLGAGYVKAWRAEAKVPAFQQAQDTLRDDWYFEPAVNQAKSDGLRALGQFIYYDATVMHGPGDDPASFGGIRAAALKNAKSPAEGGDESAYLDAFLDVRTKVMQQEEAHADTSRIDNEQRTFVREKNFDLNPPLRWKTYGDSWEIR